MSANPFHIGGPVPTEHFIVPDNAIMLQIARNIANHVATAIVSDPRFGKTSLLRYIGSPTGLAVIKHVGNDWHYLLQFIDSHMLIDEQNTSERFWKYALTPIRKIIENSSDQGLRSAYASCEETKFDPFILQELFDVMASKQIRLVLLIDEFETLINHPSLGRNSFWGALRSLMTNYQSFGIVLTSRMTVNDLNIQTQKVYASVNGSPYFNQYIQIVLKLFPQSAVISLLDRGAGVFSPIDKKFLVNVAGYHPYFLQVGAYTLWNAYQGGNHNREDSYKLVWQTLRDQAPIALNDTWAIWPLRTKQVAALLALDDMPRSLRTNIDTEALRQDLQMYKQHVDFLESRGYIRLQNNKYVLSSQILSWWISDILSRSIVEKDEMGGWLLSESRDGVLKAKQREQVIKVISAVTKIIDQNKDVFLKAILETIIKQT